MGLRLPIVLGAIATAVVVLVLAVRPQDRVVAVDVYLLVVGAGALLLVVARTIATIPRQQPSALDRPHAPGPPDVRPPELLALEREVALAAQTAFDAYYRLRPTLRHIAETSLAAHGVELDRGGRARTMLGDEAWALVRPDLPRPGRHEDPGVSLDAVEAAVSALERL